MAEGCQARQHAADVQHAGRWRLLAIYSAALCVRESPLGGRRSPARRAAGWAGFRTAAKDDRAWARGGHPGTRRHPVPVSQRLLPCQPPIDHLIRTTRANAIAARGCAEFSIVRPVTTIASSAFSGWGPALGTAGARCATPA